MLVKPSTPPPEPLQPSRSTVLNTPEPVPPKPLVDSPQPSITYNVPHVQLDADYISNAMAARLATSLLGHVLFLKSQIPFPVVQMSRMSTMNSKSTSKAAKKRIELMAAIDTLSSHLETTFLALSSAFAQREIPGAAAWKGDQPVITKEKEKEKAHMIFVVGPSVGAAKAKVALVFDGLEVKLRDDTAQAWESVSEHQQQQQDAASDSSEEEDESMASEGSALEDSSEDEAERDSGQEEAPPPPASPSPSPSPAPSRPTTPTRTTKPPPEPSPFTIYSDPLPLPSSSSSSSLPNPFLASNPTSKPLKLQTPLKPLHGPHKSRAHLTPLTPLPLPPPSHSHVAHAFQTAHRLQTADRLPLPSHSQSHSHQKALQTAHTSQAVLQTADRLLSRTLATFCAEDAGGGMSCELAPTQTHVLLRAPRRFVHPAWVPRLNLCTSLEGALKAFEEGSTTTTTTTSAFPTSTSAFPTTTASSSLHTSTSTTKQKQKWSARVGGKVEGVWVSCRDPSDEPEGGRLPEKEEDRKEGRSSQAREEEGRSSREEEGRPSREEERRSSREGEGRSSREGEGRSAREEKLAKDKKEEDEKEEKEKEEDEMIWWQWDGKIVGFSDW